MLSLNKTVRDVVLELPQATRVFEKLKIDYCCGGDKPLGEACATAGVEVASLERMLAEAGQTSIADISSHDFQKTTFNRLRRARFSVHPIWTTVSRGEVATAKRL
jgi:iron-sulfur cluster repair protein YtfE (RIC family)